MSHFHHHEEVFAIIPIHVRIGTHHLFMSKKLPFTLIYWPFLCIIAPLTIKVGIKPNYHSLDTH